MLGQKTFALGERVEMRDADARRGTVVRPARAGERDAYVVRFDRKRGDWYVRADDLRSVASVRAARQVLVTLLQHWDALVAAEEALGDEVPHDLPEQFCSGLGEVENITDEQVRAFLREWEGRPAPVTGEPRAI